MEFDHIGCRIRLYNIPIIISSLRDYKPCGSLHCYNNDIPMGFVRGGCRIKLHSFL